MKYFHGHIFFSKRSRKALCSVYTRGKTIRGNGPTELTIIGFIALHAELLLAILETLLHQRNVPKPMRHHRAPRHTRFSVIQIALAHTPIIIILLLIATELPDYSTCRLRIVRIYICA